MIKDALKFIQSSLSDHLKLRFGMDDSPAILSRVIEQDGTVPNLNKNKVVLSLLNVEHETARQYSERYARLGHNVIREVKPSQRFNLDLLFSACFDDYEEALVFLDATVAYFQANSSLSAQTSSKLPGGINKLNLDIERLDYNETHSLWSSLGAKYVPSLIYKVRLVTIQSNETANLSAAAAQQHTNAKQPS